MTYMNSPPYTDRMFRWTLRDTLDTHKITRYALAKKAEIAMNTVRAMYEGTPTRVDFPVIEKIVKALNELSKGQFHATADHVFKWEETK